MVDDQGKQWLVLEGPDYLPEFKEIQAGRVAGRVHQPDIQIMFAVRFYLDVLQTVRRADKRTIRRKFAGAIESM